MRLAELIRGARREVLATAAGVTPYLASQVVDAVSAKACSPQVQVRMLWSSCDHTDRCRIREVIRHRVQVRIAEGAVPESLLIDGRVAVVPQDPDHPARMLLAVTAPSLVSALVEGFARRWAAATHSAVICGQPDEFERSILRGLVIGMTDEAVAGKLGVSGRTVRRYVNILMDRIGARSRFELGFRAAEFGWLDSELLVNPGFGQPNSAGCGGQSPSSVAAH